MDNCNKGLGFGNNVKVGVGVGVEREVRGRVGSKSKINSSIENSINSNSASGRTFSQFVGMMRLGVFLPPCTWLRC